MQAISKRFHYFILFKIKEGKGEEPNYITYLLSKLLHDPTGLLVCILLLLVFSQVLHLDRRTVLGVHPLWLFCD